MTTNTPDPIGPDLKAMLRRLKLGRLLDTLPERLALARQQKMPHQDFLLLLLSDEVSRRDGAAVTVRVAHPAKEGGSGLAADVAGHVIWSRLEGLSHQVGIQFAADPQELHEILAALG